MLASLPSRIGLYGKSCGESIILCAEKTVALDVFFTRKLGAGLFGGEGFILQKLTGPGTTFAELDGDAVEYHLQPNQVMKVEPGHVAMFESTVRGVYAAKNE